MSDSFCTSSVSGIRCASSVHQLFLGFHISAIRLFRTVAFKIAHADTGSSSMGVDRYLSIEKLLDYLSAIDIVLGSLSFIWAESISYDKLAFSFACRTAVLAVSFSNMG